MPVLSSNSGPSRLANFDNRTVAGEVVKSLLDEVKARMDKFESSDIDEGIVNISLDVIDTKFSTLKNHARNHAREQRELNWLIWNEAMRRPGQISYFESPFRPRNTVGLEDYATSISSMRDVSQEVLMFQNSGEHRPSSSLPETHLFGHASPGSIWEQGGSPHLTGGVPLWVLSTREGQTGALQYPRRTPAQRTR